MNDDTRIAELEIKVTYLEDFVNKMNSVIITQSKKIDDLEKELHDLKLDLAHTANTDM